MTPGRTPRAAGGRAGTGRRRAPRPRRARLLRVLAGAALLLPLAGCGDATLEPLPLSIGIEASQTTAAPGDAINFLVSAQGGDLLGIETDYGDGSAEQYATGGARTARVTFRHAYSGAGTYEVRATVTDARAGSKDASLAVTIR